MYTILDLIFGTAGESRKSYLHFAKLKLCTKVLDTGNPTAIMLT